MGPIVEWDLAALLQPGPAPTSPPLALLVLNHTLRGTSTFHLLWEKACMRVAADGGANRILPLLESGTLSPPRLDAIVGDLDSLTTAANASWASTPHPPRIVRDGDQDSTDFAKAVTYIRARARDTADGGAMDIVALGGLGGRVDQALSVLHQMYSLQAEDDDAQGRLYLVTGGSVTVLLKGGRHRIRMRSEADGDGDEGDGGGGGGLLSVIEVGIAPLGGESVLTTRGLVWDVEGWKSRIGARISTSNRVRDGAAVIEVETTRGVLFTAQLRRHAE